MSESKILLGAPMQLGQALLQAGLRFNSLWRSYAWAQSDVYMDLSDELWTDELDLASHCPELACEGEPELSFEESRWRTYQSWDIEAASDDPSESMRLP